MSVTVKICLQNLPLIVHMAMHDYDTSLSLKKMTRILQVWPTMEVSQGSITKASEQCQPSQGKLNVVFYLGSVMC